MGNANGDQGVTATRCNKPDAGCSVERWWGALKYAEIHVQNVTRSHTNKPNLTYNVTSG